MSVAERNEDRGREARVLLACGDIAFGATLADFLARANYTIERCHDAQGVLRLVARHRYQVVVLDLNLREGSDVDLVSFVRRRSPETQLILLFDMEMIDRALEGIRYGAFFYLPTNSPPSDVAMVVDKAVRQLAHATAVSEFRQNVFEELVGSSGAMQRVLELISKVAPTDSTVLLLGESGTGKEVLANAIHRLSARRDQPFIAINCAALPEALLESEMFGHVKGAFTGAESDKRGLFEEADGGTIFLDEIGDMSPITQAKLLRVLQNGEIRPVGASVTKLVDVRVVAATNQDLIEAVRAHKFREDLYFRLNVITIRIPPLRERMEALPVLVEHFVRRFSQKHGKHVTGMDEAAMNILRHYDFPGNVRELESIVAHAVILADTDRIRARDLPDHVQRGGAPRLALAHTEDGVPSLAEVEERHIRYALDRLDGNQTLAAQKLGISRSTLWRKMREYGIDKEQPA
ncbi:MAG: sigma 54-interacting transcriptional regulator [Candidatus Hydrogenedentota bacterium]